MGPASVDFRVEDAGFDGVAVLHLDEDAVAAGGGEAVGEVDGGGDGFVWGGAWPCRHVEGMSVMPGIASGLASIMAGMAAEPSGWVWAKTVPSVFDEGGVAGHAEVGLHVGGGLAGGVEQVEAEGVGGAGGEGGGAVPDHGVAVGQLVGGAEQSPAESGGGSGGGVFGAERSRRAGWRGW